MRKKTCIIGSIICVLAVFLTVLTGGFFTPASAGINSKAGTSGAAFLKIGVGARAVAMGESFVAVADDANALYWNPAGISTVVKKELSVMYNKWLIDTNYGFIGFVHPLENCSVGLSVLYLDYGKIDGWSDTNQPEPDFTANDIAVGISCGKKLNEKLSVGATLKSVQSKIEKESAQTITADAGILLSFAAGDTAGEFKTGLSLQNIVGQLKFIDKAYQLPANIKAGCAYSPVNKPMTITMDVNIPNDNDISANIGLEFRIKQMLALRGGYKLKLTGNDDTGGLSNLTAGIGFIYSPVQIDYALVPYGNLDTSHRVSFSVKF
ncbi:MAG: PorV/PorQ family protein [Elusimicrobiota bacterium]